jgi:hypothetical protein
VLFEWKVTSNLTFEDFGRIQSINSGRVDSLQKVESSVLFALNVESSRQCSFSPRNIVLVLVGSCGFCSVVSLLRERTSKGRERENGFGFSYIVILESLNVQLDAGTGRLEDEPVEWKEEPKLKTQSLVS